MDDRRTSTLQYGQLGTATYIPDLQLWQFSRGLKNDRDLTFIGGVTISPGENASSRALPLRSNGRLNHSITENLLLDAHPQLAPSLNLTQRHEAASRAVTESVSRFDPLVSSLFALGDASVFDGNRVSDRTVPFIVFASQASPASLSLFPFDSDRLQYPPGSQVSIELPIVDYQRNARWTGKGARIEQIVASDGLDEKSLFIAARFSMSTVILRPLYHKSLSYGTHPHSLDANPLLEIPNSSTGLQPHADVAFNPWYQRQVGIVDTSGNWSIWDVQGRQPYKGHWHAEPGPSGSLSDLSLEDGLFGSQREHHDGWAAILWLGNLHHIMVCDRRTIALFRTDVNPPERHAVDLRFERQSEWVLSVCRSKSNAGHAFVVTSTRVIWLTLAVDDISDGDIGGRISILLSWKHFRDIEDTSLTLATCLVRDEIYGILYSRLNTLAQVIRFSMAPEDPSVPVSASDPSILVLPSLTPTITANSPGPGIYSSITLRDIVHDLIADTSNTSESLKLLKFIGQRTDSRIVEALYSVKMESNDVSEGLKGTNSLVPSKGRRRGNASMLSSAWATDDDFVVDDEEADDLPLRSSSKNHSIRKPPSHLSEQWTNIHVSICSAVVEALDSKGENVQSNASVDGVESLDTMFWSSLEEQPESSMARTMSVAQLFFFSSLGLPADRYRLDFLGAVPSIQEIDKDSHEFEVFVTQSFGSEQDSKTGYRPVYLPLPWSSASRLSLAYPSAELSDLGIARLYDSLVFDWLSPLSEKIPGKIRVSKERLIRKILSELVASRIVFYRERIQSSYPENGANDEHPLRPESPMLKSELDFSSQPTLPGVSLSQDTADFPPSSQPPSQPFAADSSESIPTLQLYTSLSVQPQISRRVALTTSHWETSADPASYDWDAETRRVQEEEELYGEDPQAIQRRKRRAERRRQRQLERMSQQSNVSSSVAPSVMIESSQPPDLPSSSFGRVLPSTQTVEVHIPSSQVFPASFGSREAGKKPLAKDRKKKRAAGF